MEFFSSNIEAVLAQFSTVELVAAAIIVMLGTTFQYSVGIGFGVFVGPLLALIAIDFVPVPVLFLTFLTSFSSAFAEWKLVHFDEVKFSVGGRLLGSILAASVISFLPNEKMFTLLFGLTVGFLVLISFVGIKPVFNLKSIGAAGFVSGITATLTSVGGPPMALVYQDQTAKNARPTLQVFFLFGSFFSILVLAISGFITVQHIFLALFLVPGFFAGMLLGPKMRPLFDKNFRYWILGIAAVSSLMLVYKGLS
ncbi:MAG: TSUP family transporter [Nitratireductor sp.]